MYKAQKAVFMMDPTTARHGRVPVIRPSSAMSVASTASASSAPGVREGRSTPSFARGNAPDISSFKRYMTPEYLSSIVSKEDPATLTVLNLSVRAGANEPKIEKIENLDKFKSIEKLNLSGNVIRTIENLDTLVRLRELNLENNQIHSLDGIDKLVRLTELNVAGNQLRHLPPALGKLHSLKVLRLARNEIGELCELDALKEVAKLANMTLGGNPVSLLPDCRLYAVFVSRSLQVLDGTQVTVTERAEADQRFKLDDELARLREENRRLVAVSEGLQSDAKKSKLEADTLQREVQRTSGRIVELQGKLAEAQSKLSKEHVTFDSTSAELAAAHRKCSELEQELTFYKLDFAFADDADDDDSRLKTGDGDEVNTESVDDSPYIGKGNFSIPGGRQPRSKSQRMHTGPLTRDVHGNTLTWDDIARIEMRLNELRQHAGLLDEHIADRREQAAAGAETAAELDAQIQALLDLEAIATPDDRERVAGKREMVQQQLDEVLQSLADLDADATASAMERDAIAMEISEIASSCDVDRSHPMYRAIITPLVEAYTEIEQLRTRCAELEQELESSRDHEAELEAEASRRAAVQADLETLQGQHDEILTRVVTTQSDLEAVQTQTNEAHAAKDAAIEEVNALTDSIASLSAAREALAKETRVLEDKVHALKEAVGYLQADSAEIERLRARAGGLENELESARQQVHALNSEIVQQAAVRADLDALQRQHEDMLMRCERAKGDLEAIRAQADMARAAKDAAREASMTEIDGLNNNIASLSATREALSRETRIIEEQMHAMKDAVGYLQADTTEITRLRARAAGLENELESARQQVHALNSEIAQQAAVRADLEALQRRHEDVLAQCERAKDDLEAFRAQAEAERAAKDAALEKAQELRADLETLSATNEALSEDVRRVGQQLQVVQGTAGGLKVDAAEIEWLRTRAAGLENELESARQQVHALNFEIKRRAAAQADLDALQKQHEDMLAQCERAKGDLEAARAQVNVLWASKETIIKETMSLTSTRDSLLEDTRRIEAQLRVAQGFRVQALADAERDAASWIQKARESEQSALDEVRKTLQSLRSDVAAFENLLTSLRGQVDEAEAKRLALRHAADAERDSLARLQAVKEEAERTLGSLQADIASAKAARESASVAAAVLESQRDAVSRIRVARESEQLALDEVIAACNDLSAKRARLTDDIASLERRRNETADALSVDQAKHQSLCSDVAALEGVLGDLRVRVDEAEAKSAALRHVADAERDSLARLHASKEESERRLASLQSEIASATAARDSASAAVTSLLAQRDALAAEITAAEDAWGSLEERDGDIHAAQNAAQRAEGRAEFLERELSGKRRDEAKVTELLHTTMAQLEHVSMTLEEERKELARQSATATKAHATLAEANHRLEALREADGREIDQLTRLLFEQREQSAELSSRVSELKIENAHLRSELTVAEMSRNKTAPSASRSAVTAALAPASSKGATADAGDRGAAHKQRTAEYERSVARLKEELAELERRRKAVLSELDGPGGYGDIAAEVRRLRDRRGRHVEVMIVDKQEHMALRHECAAVRDILRRQEDALSSLSERARASTAGGASLATDRTGEQYSFRRPPPAIDYAFVSAEKESLRDRVRRIERTGAATAAGLGSLDYAPSASTAQGYKAPSSAHASRRVHSDVYGRSSDVSNAHDASARRIHSDGMSY